MAPSPPDALGLGPPAEPRRSLGSQLRAGPSESPRWPLGQGLAPVTGRPGVRAQGPEATGETGCGFVQSQPERAGSFRLFPSVNLKRDKRTKPKRGLRREASPQPAAPEPSCSFRFGKNWLPPHSSRAAGPRGGRVRSPSGLPVSRRLSLQGLAELGRPHCLPSERLSWPSMRLCTSPGSWAALPPPLPPHSALALPPPPSGGFQPASRCARLCGPGSQRGLPVLSQGASPRSRGLSLRPGELGELGGGAGWPGRGRPFSR